MIARAVDENCFVLMASLDLSMAFDLVNVELLVKRLKIMGFPQDLITLIREWLTGRSSCLTELVNEPRASLFYSLYISMRLLVLCKLSW